MSLYRKHVLSVGAVFVVVGGLLIWLNYWLAQQHIEDAKKDRVALLAEVVTNGLKTIMLEGRPKEEFQRFLDGFAAEDIRAVRVFTDNGIIISSTVPGEVGRVIDNQHILAFKSHKGNSIFVHRAQDMKVYSSIMIMGNDWPCQRCHGTGDEIRAIVDLEVMQGKEESAVVLSVLRTAAAWIFLSGLFLLVVSVLARVQLKRPFERVTERLKRIAGGELALRVDEAGPDELAALAEGINRIAGDLEKARETVHRYESAETSQLEKMASIGELAATVAHEIKNPLAGISGALQVMAEDIPEESPRKEICNEILSEIDRLDSCVKELIMFARPQEMNPMMVDLNLTVAQTVASVREAAGAGGVSIEERLGELPELMADPEQIGRVVADVIFYQLQNMPEGGTITVSTLYEQQTDEIFIIAADTAAALTSEKIRNIFRPSFSTRNTGSGLGLAISRNMIENHGGRIRVESEPGIGNFFHIIIPCTRA